MKPLIKWPGGKAGEISEIYGMIPDHDRYIEPFFGGGALFFHLMPEYAAINDTCEELMDFYRQVQRQEPEFKACLQNYAAGFAGLLEFARAHTTELLDLLGQERDACSAKTAQWMDGILPLFGTLVPDAERFCRELDAALWDKIVRTRKNHAVKPFSPDDLAENLVTGLMSGCYLYFRGIYNDHRLGERSLSAPEAAAIFFFVRENCYGSMFRYNRAGAFNIPYGGMSYNRKDFAGKVQALCKDETAAVLRNTTISAVDFEAFLEEIKPGEGDFIFLDPPYDTEFSDYDGNAFTKLDHARLAVALSKTRAKFLLIIKHTPFIEALYGHGFHIRSFGKHYTYNVRSRNDRLAEHWIVTNYSPVSDGKDTP